MDHALRVFECRYRSLVIRTNGSNFAAGIEARYIVAQWQQHGRLFTRSGEPERLPNVHDGRNKYLTNATKSKRTESVDLSAQSSVERLQASMLHLWRSSQWQALRRLQVYNILCSFTSRMFILRGLSLMPMGCLCILVVRDARASSNERFARTCRMHAARTKTVRSTSDNETVANTAGIKNV